MLITLALGLHSEAAVAKSLKLVAKTGVPYWHIKYCCKKSSKEESG
jgi:hypothetical protein